MSLKLGQRKGLLLRVALVRELTHLQRHDMKYIHQLNLLRKQLSKIKFL